MRFKQIAKWGFFVAFLSEGHFALAEGEGRIVTANGPVTINGAPAKVGDIVPAGTKVETAQGATASVIFDTDNVVRMTSNTAVSVESAPKGACTVFLERGAVDGVKKTGTDSKTSIVVKTDSAVFELKSGRYSVRKNAGGVANSRFVAIDGDASLTYLKPTESKNAGDKVSLSAGAFVEVVRSSKSNSPNLMASEVKTLSEKKALELRSSAEVSTSNEEVAKKLAQAIVAPLGESPQVPSRRPASVPSAQEIAAGGGSPGRDGVLPPPTIPRDPLQNIPGRAKAAVSVIFQP